MKTKHFGEYIFDIINFTYYTTYLILLTLFYSLSFLTTSLGIYLFLQETCLRILMTSPVISREYFFAVGKLTKSKRFSFLLPFPGLAFSYFMGLYIVVGEVFIFSILSVYPKSDVKNQSFVEE